MVDIKIGNTVQPTTAGNLKKLGVGVVVRIDKYKHKSIIVIFPSSQETFQIKAFDDSHLVLATPKPEKLQELVDIINIYRQMQMEISRA